MGYSVGKEDLKVIPLMKSLAAELLGTMLLVIFGCGTAMQVNGNGYETKVSLAFGLAVMAIACFTGHVSGGEFSLVILKLNVKISVHCSGHLNPAVSVGLLAGGKLSVIKCCLYIVAQCLGAIAGQSVLTVLSPQHDTRSRDTVRSHREGYERRSRSQWNSD